MMRVVLACLLGLTISLGAAARDDQKTDKNKGHEATITKVDAKNHSLTVKMKDKDGKEVEKTFKLAETVRYLDSTGKVAAIDIFKSGDMALVVEEEGQLKELHKKKDANDKGEKGEKK
jgi:uncharacterized protein YigE (DUF2233 family)